MFEGLGDRLQRVFKDLRGEGTLTEFHLETALREIRLSLLEADVSLPVVKSFLAKVKEQAVGEKVATALSPAQEVLRIVRDQLVDLLGGARADLDLRARPVSILLVGLQGSGKTTTAAKLARFLKETRGRHALLVPCDLARPAAVAQLGVLGRKIGVPVFDVAGRRDPLEVARDAAAEARLTGRDAVLYDTAGRLHVDDELMDQVARLKEAVAPQETLFVADAMTGQDAVRSASAFHARLDVTGVVFTKTDGDTRGGAALSIVSTIGRPIKFVGTGEKIEDLEPFHPDRMASRILGMGDMLSLIEKVEQSIDAEEAARIAKKAGAGEFTLEDLRDQLDSMRKMGPLSQVLDFLPKIGPFRQLPSAAEMDPKALTRIGAIIDSMTPDERRYPQIVNGSRRKRIARGSGTKVEDVNRLLKQHAQMKKMMKSMKGLGRGLRPRDGKNLSLPGH
ncbi:MAG TPA: signal recognition particle protein [Thermoanaerobaculia bacterium]|nr:signal recognition particle protein [Thermoanaerobaculia bacterium]